MFARYLQRADVNLSLRCQKLLTIG